MFVPQTRKEMILDAAANGEELPFKLLTREEMYLAHIAGFDIAPPKPVSRYEMLLSEIEPGGNQLVTIPSLISIDANWEGVSGIKNLCIPSVTNIAMGVFNKNAELESIDAPLCTSVGSGAFATCTALKRVNMPVLSSISEAAFTGCASLTELSLPKASNLSQSAFTSCTSLEKVDFGIGVTIPANGLGGCSKLKTIICRDTEDCLSYVAPFGSSLGGTLFASGEGFLYVPASMVDTYKANEMWSAYANQIRAIEDYPEICGET